MIRLVHGSERHRFARELDEYHRIRKKVFHERMGWDVPIINAWEVDGFDVLNPLYCIATDTSDRVIGGLRLLPTMGFNMLNDVFGVLLPEGKRIESPLIWESSRFAVDHTVDVPSGPSGLGRATAELGLAMNEVGRRAGLTHVVTVYDALMHRVLKRAGCAGEPISEPQRVGKVLAYAVFFEIGDETEAALRKASGITGPVIDEASWRSVALPMAA
jgi:acyl homoserine lactone synthase